MTDPSLQQIMQKLDTLETLIRDQALGFHTFTRTRRSIFVGREQPYQSPWYHWDGGKKERIDIEDNAISAYLVGLELVEKEPYKGQRKFKICAYLDTIFGNFTLQSGWNPNDPSGTTLASKGLVEALASLKDPSVLRKPVTISVAGGSDEPKVVFLNLSVNKKPVFFDRLSPDEWRHHQDRVLQNAIAAVESVWGPARRLHRERNADDDTEGDTSVAPVNTPAQPAAKAAPAAQTTVTDSAQWDLVREFVKSAGLGKEEAIDFTNMSLQSCELPHDPAKPHLTVNALEGQDFSRFFCELLRTWAFNLTRNIGSDVAPEFEPMFPDTGAVANAWNEFLKQHNPKDLRQSYKLWAVYLGAQTR